jgi:thioredoxin reductase
MTAERKIHCDVAIVGGGPAGLSAATELKMRGAGPVLVLDREASAGGIPRHCGHYPFGMRELGRVLKGPDYAARLVARAEAAGVAVLTQATVTALEPGPKLRVTTPEGLVSVVAKRVLLATGVRERSRTERLIGGTKPGGILSTGALQGLVYLDHLMPFRHPVVLGTELVSFSALLTCRHAGIRPVAMVEPGLRITAWRGSDLLPRMLGIPLLLGTSIRRILGRDRVEAVEVADGGGRPRLIETDGVIVSGQFVPESPLIRASHLVIDPASGGPEVDQFLRLSDPDYFAAGNLLRPVETSGWCWNEGRSAAKAIEQSLAGTLPPPEPSLRLRLAGGAIKFAVPRRLVAVPAQGALKDLQLRVARPVRGTLSIAVDGHTVWSEARAALPERRILVPLTWLSAGMHGIATVSFEEHSG